MKSEHFFYLGLFLLGVTVAFLVAAMFGLESNSERFRREQAECIDQGREVIPIHGSDRGEWLCI